VRILEVLAAPYSIRDQIGALEGRALDLLKKIGTKLLFIDEVHQLLAGSALKSRRSCCWSETVTARSVFEGSDNFRHHRDQTRI
jgi:hypothetical protein